jgi:hypothetical protein
MHEGRHTKTDERQEVVVRASLEGLLGWKLQS